MDGDREELEALRRLAELEARSKAAPKVPEREQTAVREMLGLEPLSEKETAFRKQQREGGWGTGIPKAAEQFGGWVTDKTGSPEAGLVANVAAQLPTSLFGYRAAPQQVSATEPMAKWLMTKAVKPSTEDIVNKSADKAMGTMLREGQLATPGGMIKAQQIVNEIHPQVQGEIEKSAAEVPVDTIGQKFLEQYNKALPKGKAAVQEVIDTWKNFIENPLIAGSDSMSAMMADVMKRGQQGLSRANYGKETGEASKALAAHIREGLVDAVPAIKEPLAREAANMNVLDVARNSIAQSTKANPAGLAALRADDAIPMMGFLADRSPLIKSLLAHMIYHGGRPEVALPAATAASKVPELFKQE